MSRANDRVMVQAFTYCGCAVQQFFVILPKLARMCAYACACMHINKFHVHNFQKDYSKIGKCVRIWPPVSLQGAVPTAMIYAGD